MEIIILPQRDFKESNYVLNLHFSKIKLQIESWIPDQVGNDGVMSS